MSNSKTSNDEQRQEFEKAFVATLIKDAEAAIRRFGSSGREVQQARRDLVRSLHATIEGVVWAFREHVRSSSKTMDLLTSAEEAVLSETTFQVSDSGAISIQPRYLPMLGAVRLACKIATKINPTFSVNFDGKEWADFRQAVATRNRLMHPKTLADLAVSSGEIATVISSFFWILEVSIRAMEASVEALRDFVTKLDEVLQGLKIGDPEIVQMVEIVKAHRQALGDD
ncbi:hypothetical protein [Novosphingobium sp. CECT 9465]|uniref:hypothetical protein n=1 Tax=Novosphingobium sp. CECT 9465 TaxID=2829794 RepID=UPI001E587C61|nr:hypothetical protein [Novosphingobium sp. CECT 9465]CAH0495204.1 hypothetical protein NVSP9465_00209 [Novosphingobium sp. CECT 9465]